MQPGFLSRFQRPGKGAPVDAALHGAVYDALNAGTPPKEGQALDQTVEIMIRLTGRCDGTLATSLQGDSPATGFVPTGAQPFFKWVQVQWDPVNNNYKDLAAGAISTLDNSQGLDYMAFGFAKPISGFAAIGSIVKARQVIIRGLAPFMEFDGGWAAVYRVSANTVITADRKWKYSLTPQKENTAATLGSAAPRWVDDPDGTVLTNCLNELEDNNQTTPGPMGNGMDLSAAPFGTTTGTLAQKLLPVASPTLVEVTRTSSDGAMTPTIWSWFRFINVVQGDCQTGSGSSS